MDWRYDKKKGCTTIACQQRCYGKKFKFILIFKDWKTRDASADFIHFRSTLFLIPIFTTLIFHTYMCCFSSSSSMILFEKHDDISFSLVFTSTNYFAIQCSFFFHFPENAMRTRLHSMLRTGERCSILFHSNSLECSVLYARIIPIDTNEYVKFL